MFFQINITPKEKKTAEPIARSQPNNNYSLLLAPFQPPTRIKLDTKVNTPVECTLEIKNTNNRYLTASITKIPPQERCVNLSATEWSIQPESSVTLNILWEPREGGSWRDTLQLSDSRKIKYDIPLILTCTDPNKKSKGGKIKRNIPLGPKHPPNVTQKNNVPLKKSAPSNSNEQTGLRNKVQPVSKRTRSIANVPDKENVSNNVGFNWMLEQARTKKQKTDQVPQSMDFSKFLDSSTFKFTPLKPKVNCFGTDQNQDTVSFTPNHGVSCTDESWLLKQESITVESKVHMTLRKETYVTVPKFLNIPKSPGGSGNNDEFDDSLSPKPVEVDSNNKPHSEISMLLNDIKFTPFKKSNSKNNGDIKFSPNFCSTDKKSDRSKSFSDDSVNNSTNKNATFDIDSNDGSKQNDTYELPTSPTSTKHSTILKPTCLAKTFEKSNLEIGFSTPLPINKHLESVADHTRYSNLFSKSQVDFGSAKDCLEADLWVKSKNTSLSPMSKSILHSTLESIREEDMHSSDSEETNKHYTMYDHEENWKKTQGVIIEISPPKKNAFKKPPIRKVSPTKTGRITKEKSATETANLKKKIQVNKSIKSNGTIQIPGVRIAKLSLAGLNKDKNKSLKKQPKEVSVKLHDPNDFLMMFCNPDPFAATMTCDPFLSNSLYYDEQWIFIQELEFKKWLNALLTPPEHLNTDVESATIDIGKVWQSCRTREDVTLAETKESLSARYHTNTRLNALRKAACIMYRKPDVITVLSQTTVSIEKEILTIRPDKDLHRDIGLQKIILECFISYNPLWLRIGLETIYGETIPLQSNNDIIGLSRFLLNRFFSDPFIVKQHSSSAHPNIRLKTFQNVMNKFMMKKFLFVVYFLDYAKRNKLIGHDPCLFHKKAPMKDSRSILLTFSRECLCGIGDITKVLRHYNYVVSHKQTYLDEYDYAVTNLSTDLRDGVRLCRVMELITGQKSLTCQCRVPAVSRLQKVHNVKVALDTLNEAGYTIAGGIDSKAIADGHREKTLSLLWQMIYKFQAPRFEKSAKVLQRWWRSKMWYVCVKKMLRNRKHDAASTIQRAWKCYLARKELQKLKEEYARLMQIRVEAAKKIQRHWRLRREAKRQQMMYQLQRTSAMKIQKCWRRYRSTRPFVEKFKSERDRIISLQRLWRARQLMKSDRRRFLQFKASAAVIITFWRARALAKEMTQNYQKKRKAVMLIQRKWRAELLMRRDRQDYLKKLKAIRLIQNCWRRYLVLKRDREHFLALKNAVRTMEKVWIVKKFISEERKNFLAQRTSAIMIQRVWRNYSSTKSYVSTYKAKKISCLKIQTWWRSVKARRNYLKERASCIALQKWWRSVLLTKKERSTFLKLKESAVVVQKTWKMKVGRKNYLLIKNAVLKIELSYKNLIFSRKVRSDYLKIQAAARVLQTRWIASKKARIARSEYLESRKAIILLQRRWRAKIARRDAQEKYLKLRKSVIKIQSYWRMICQKRKFQEHLRRKRAAIVFQNRWRALQCGRQTRNHYLEYKSAVVNIQRRRRATVLARTGRSNYLRIREAAVTIQKQWRCLVLFRLFQKNKQAVRIIEERRKHQLLGRQTRKEYLQLRASALKIQELWRRKQRLRKLEKQIQSAIVIQKHWRTWRAMKEFDEKKLATIIIQRWIRLVRAGRLERERFLTFRQNVLKIQRLWRYALEMKRRREAAIVIQKYWRSYFSRKEYQKKKLATMVIQCFWRNLVLARNARTEYLTVRTNIIRIQSFWRMKSEATKYQKLRDAAIVLQKNWRRVPILREYKQKKMAVRVVENWRQNILIGREARLQYLAVRAAVIRIQSLWRMKLEANKYKKLRDASIILQKNWRRISALRDYRRKKTAVCVLENWWKNILLGREVRFEYLRLKMTVVRIQFLFRVKLIAKRFRQQRNAAIKVQRFWRSVLETRRCMQEFKRQRSSVIALQRRYRAKRLGDTVRKDYQNCISAIRKIQTCWKRVLFKRRLQENREKRKWAALVIENWWINSSEERRVREIEKAEHRRKCQAATAIQSFWRGYRIRRKACKKISELRERSKQAAKDAVPKATLGFRLQENIAIFQYASNIGQLSLSLSSLDVITRLLPIACIEVCKMNIVSKLYEVLAQANRSLPWLDVCLKDISILLTLAKFKPTNPEVRKIEYIEVLASLLKISMDKKEELFLHTSTLIWILTKDQEYTEAMKNCPRTKYLLQTIFTTRRHKAGENCAKRKSILPNLKPDWGLRHKHPRTFDSVNQAITQLATRFNMLNITPPTDMQRSFNFSMRA